MNKSGVMKLLIIIVSLCVLAGISVGVYSLMKKPNTTEEPSTVSSSSIEPTATQESESRANLANRGAQGATETAQEAKVVAQ